MIMTKEEKKGKRNLLDGKCPRCNKLLSWNYSSNIYTCDDGFRITAQEFRDRIRQIK